MARFQQRLDAEAFETLLARLSRPALGAATQLLASASLAEDAVQEAFLRVVRARDSYRPDRPFTSWFYALLRNVCTDMLRRKARQAKALADAAVARPVAVEARQDGLDVPELLGRLPRLDRTVLTLRILEGLSFAEIAAVLEMTTEAAKKRAQRALRRLREDRHVRRWLRDGWGRRDVAENVVPDLMRQT